MKLRFGFTMIELMIVTGIISVLSVSFVLISKPIIRKSQISKENAQLKQVAMAISKLTLDTGLMPGQLPIEPCVQSPHLPITDCNSGLFNRCSPSDYPGWNGPYLTTSLRSDQWGTNYTLDFDYLCRPGIAGCENVSYNQSDYFGQNKLVRALVSSGPDRSNEYCYNAGSSCTRRDRDNVVLVLCGQ